MSVFNDYNIYLHLRQITYCKFNRTRTFFFIGQFLFVLLIYLSVRYDPYTLTFYGRIAYDVIFLFGYIAAQGQVISVPLDGKGTMNDALVGKLQNLNMQKYL